MAGDNSNRLLDLLNTGEDSDVTFVVGHQKEEIQGHRMILKAYCGFFKTMFKEQPEQDRVEIPDVKPLYFKKFLEIVYNSGSDSACLAAEDVIPLMDLAKRFDAQNVATLCSKKLKTALTEDSALKIFEQAVLYKESELEKAATELICEKAFKLIDSPEFLKLPAELVCKLLRLDELRVVSEDQILEFCISWAKDECNRQNTIVTPKYMRSVLEKIIPLIRFSQMDVSDFAVSVLKHRILTTEEIQEVYLYNDVSEKEWHKIPTGLFNPNPRQYYKPVNRIIKRLDTKVHTECKNDGYCAYPENHIPGDSNNWHRISLCCDADVKLASIGINEECQYSDSDEEYGDSDEECQYSDKLKARQVTIKVEKEGVEVATNIKTGPMARNIESPFLFGFDKPVKLDANCWYTLSVLVQPPYRGMNYYSRSGNTITTEDSRNKLVKFEFKNAVPGGAAETTVSEGQMAELEFLV